MRCRAFFSVIWMIGCSVQAVFSQTTISGVIKNSKTNQPISDVLCRITDTKQQTYWGYGITDAEGQYRISINTHRDTIVLIFSSIGYETQTYTLPNITQRKNVTLNEAPYTLKEITVTPPPIWKRGDTLNYNVEALKSNNDYYIIDVIKKLPGIEVLEGGQIKYQGTAINKFYIEGLDLMERKYNIASNNIPAEAVEDVQIFENHQPVKALKNVRFSEAAALNLSLKKAYKMRPVVSADIGSGYMSDKNRLRLLNVTAMQIGKNNQALLTAKLNNTGMDLSNELTEHTLTDIQQLTVYTDLFNPQTTIIPHEIIKPSLFNNSYAATYNHLLRVTDDAQLRLTASYLNEKKWRNYMIRNQYYMGEDDYWRLDESGRLTNHNHTSDVNITFTSNKEKSYVDNSLKLSGAWNTSQAQVTGSYPNRQHFHLPMYTIKNRLNTIVKHNKKTLSFSSVLDYCNLPQSVKIWSDSIMNTNGEPIKQNTRKNTFYTTNDLSLSHSAGYSLYSLNLTFDADVNMLKSHMNTDTFFKAYRHTQNHLNYNRYNVTVTPRYQFKKGAFFAQISSPFSLITLTHRQKKHANKTDKHYFFITPNLTIRYEINKYWNTVLSYACKKQTGDIFDFADGLRFLNYQTLTNGNSLYELRTTHSYVSRWMYKNPVEALFFNLTAMYKSSKSNLINSVSFVDTYKIKQMQEKENKRDHYLITANIAKYIDPLQTNVSLTGNYNIIKFKQSQQRKTYDVTNHAYHIYGNINSKIGLKNSVSLNIAYMANMVKSPLRSTNTIGQWHINGNWNYYPSNKWQFSTHCDYSRNQLQSRERTDLWLMNADITYKTIKWHCILSIRNIWNNKTYKILTYDGLNTFLSAYHLRGREILLSIRLKL